MISITADIGSIGIVNKNIGEAYVNQHIALTRPLNKKIYSRWMAYNLLSIVGKPQFGLLLCGGTKDGLSLEDVRNLFILVTTMEEQKSIAHFLDQETSKIDTLIEKTKTSIEKLKEYRTALISAAVTGKIDIREEI